MTRRFRLGNAECVLLRQAGFVDVTLDTWRGYDFSEGKFSSAFARATKPAFQPCGGSECSKSWDDFAGADAPSMDVEDPAAVDGSREEQLRAFEQACRDLEQRTQAFVTTRTS